MTTRQISLPTITPIEPSMRVGLEVLLPWQILSWGFKLRLTRLEMIFAKTHLERLQNSQLLLTDGIWIVWMAQTWKWRRAGLGLMPKVENTTSGDILITTILVDHGYGLKRLLQETASFHNIIQSLDLTNFDDFINFAFDWGEYINNFNNVSPENSIKINYPRSVFRKVDSIEV